MVRTMTGVMAVALALSLTGPVWAAKATPKAATCPACHMALSTKKTKTNTKMVKIGGKTYYCCAQCNMKAAGGAKGAAK